MKILVIDDTQKHLDSAIQTLVGHDVTLCATYDEAYELISTGGWDVVLSDLLMPAGKRSQGEGMKYVGQEIPVGWALALEAVQAGAKYVAVVTDANHHAHPASAMLDSISTTIFEINGAKMLMTNGGAGYFYGKPWGRILDSLIEGKVKMPVSRVNTVAD